MPTDVALQLDLAFRLVVAAVLGALIGLEREIHDHPAGMRTHLLVCMGSTMFTVVSIFGFVHVLPPGEGSAPDPTRIAAQIVTGIGFLGAGAILKYGTSVRGLTTAASMWATSAVGIAVGAGEYLVGGVGALLILFSLWPLGRIAERIHRTSGHVVHLALNLRGLEAMGAISAAVVAHRLELAGIQSQRTGKNRFEVHLDVRVRSATDLGKLVEDLGAMTDVEVVETGSGGE
jgi:putative Mg2+ transporter-C (MgtC) family protein